MIIENRKYGVFDLLRIPLACAPVTAIFAGLQVILAGIIPTVQVVVTARFIGTAVFIVENRATLNMIYPVLFTVVILIAYQWISGELAKFAQAFRITLNNLYLRRLTFDGLLSEGPIKNPPFSRPPYNRI